MDESYRLQFVCRSSGLVTVLSSSSFYSYFTILTSGGDLQTKYKQNMLTIKCTHHVHCTGSHEVRNSTSTSYFCAFAQFHTTLKGIESRARLP